jgi:hypothetical protein
VSATANTAKAPPPSPPEPARARRIPDYDRRLAATPPPSTWVSTPLGLLEITVCDHDRVSVHGWFTLNKAHHIAHAALKVHRKRGWLLCPTGCEKHFAALAEDVRRHGAMKLLHATTGRPASPTAVIKAAIVVEDAVREWAMSGRGSAMLTQGAKRAHCRSMRVLEQLVIAADESALVARAEARKARGEMRALDKRQAAREQAGAQSTPAERT